MNKVIFEFYISQSEAKIDNEELDIAKLSLPELKKIASGKIFIFFENKSHKEYIILETGIIDYLIQFKNVIEEIESGNFTPFSVSSDWFSNSLKYIYNKNESSLEIIDVNEQEFDIITNYEKFKKSFLNFRNKAIAELKILYPELHNNNYFISIFEN